MTRAHIPVGVGDSIGNGQFTVLAVHVVGAGSRVISEPNSVILYASIWVLLVNFLDFHYLTSSLLDLLELSQKVPKSRLCYNLILGIDGHAVHLRSWILVARQLAANNSVLVERHCSNMFILYVSSLKIVAIIIIVLYKLFYRRIQMENINRRG